MDTENHQKLDIELLVIWIRIIGTDERHGHNRSIRNVDMEKANEGKLERQYVALEYTNFKTSTGFYLNILKFENITLTF